MGECNRSAYNSPIGSIIRGSKSLLCDSARIALLLRASQRIILINLSNATLVCFLYIVNQRITEIASFITSLFLLGANPQDIAVVMSCHARPSHYIHPLWRQLSKVVCMLMINLLAFAFLLLNAMRRALLTFHPSKNAHEWCIMAINLRNDGQSSLSKKLSPYQSWIKQCLGFSLGVHLAIQFLQDQLPSPLILLGIFNSLLLLLACIDWFYFRLPNLLTFILMVMGSISSIFLLGVEPIDLIVRCTCCYGAMWLIQGIYFKLRHKVGLGSGDVKLITGLACWFDIYQLSLLILFASIIALPFCLLQYRNLSSLHTVIVPFGTFLSLSGIYCAYVFYQDIFNSLPIAIYL
ncbi:Type IV leader peptidase family protein [Rosenbergiella nectarea]|uniref:Type IV leader peptidase family protein n=1 Tax=Rosenbergiella nectarea TaxID=988801 RepID=A0A1H9MT46_9GAMM|nr:Type IV leader peptidase family protein [Rosenbergiella nectarea]